MDGSKTADEVVDKYLLDAWRTANNALREAQREPLAALNALNGLINAKYKLTPKDTLNIDTGVITRGPEASD